MILPSGVKSGLAMLARFEEDEMIGIVRFTADDCVRSMLPANAESLLLIAISVQSPGTGLCYFDAATRAGSEALTPVNPIAPSASSLPCVFGSKNRVAKISSRYRRASSVMRGERPAADAQTNHQRPKTTDAATKVKQHVLRRKRGPVAGRYQK